MAGRNVRSRNTLVAVRAETTPGVDAFLTTGGPDPAADFFKVTVVTPDTPQDTSNTNELSGELDDTPPTPGGLRGTVTLGVVLRPSGTPGIAPPWGRLMEACSWRQMVTATPIGAPTAATAGDARTATLAAPFAATAQLYRGMPMELSGNPNPETVAYVEDYTAARVARFGYEFAAALGADTLARIPAHVLYAPTSNLDDIHSVTVYVYEDGFLTKLLGQVGSVSLGMQAGQAPVLTFTLNGQFGGLSEAPMPTGVTYQEQPAPLFKDGVSRLNGALARVGAITFDGGARTENPPNPEAPEGYDPAIITGRGSTGRINPLRTTVRTIEIFERFRKGETHSYVAAMGRTPGQRVGLVAPGLQATARANEQIGSLTADGYTFGTTIPGAPWFLALS